MKKLLIFLLILVISLSFVACGNNEKKTNGDNNDVNPSGNVAVSKDYFTWAATNENQITGYTELGLKQTNIVIPDNCESVQGLKDNTTVKTIVFKNDDTTIKPNTFNGCTSLESITLPKNLKEIEYDVFNGCTNLKSIEIPSSVTKIGSDAFEACTSLETVKLGAAVTEIGSGAFTKCTSLKSIEIPNSVTVIGKSAFEECTGMTTVAFGSGLLTVEESAFQSCDSLTKVELPEGLKTLEKDAFSFCDSLKSIFIPASVDSAALSCIAQTHDITVYVEQGSYMDGRISELMGEKFYNKQYH